MRVHSCLYICLPTGQNHRATELEMNQFKFSTKASSNQLLTWTLHNSQFVEQKMHMKCHQYYLFIIHIFFLLPLIPSFPFGYNLYHNTTQISSRQSCVIEKTHTMNGNCIVTNHWLHDFFHSRIHGFYWNGSGYLQMLLLLVLFGIYIYHIYIYAEQYCRWLTNTLTRSLYLISVINESFVFKRCRSRNRQGRTVQYTVVEFAY